MSIARGEATIDSEIDLAVIATRTWDKRAEMQDIVSARLGNRCDVLVFTETEFQRLAAGGEPVVRGILHDGIAMLGTKPWIKHGAA